MTEIVIARRSGTLKTAKGDRVRLIAGRTLAHADHRAVTEYPEAFMPVTIALRTEEGTATAGHDPETGECGAARERDDLREQLTEVEETAERYRAQLATIADALHERGLIAGDVDTDTEGWLTDVVLAAVDGTAHAAPTVTEMPTAAVEPGETPAPVKRAPRRRPTTTAAASDGDES